MFTRAALGSLFTAWHLRITIALGLALCASLAANTLQHYSAAAAAADCTAAAAKKDAAIAAANAEAARLRAERVGTLNLLLAEDAATARAALERATSRINNAAASYRAAQQANPTTCRASADHVRAVNAARGVQ